MGDKRQINGRDILNDLRSGMAAWELQVKYKLSAKSLQAIFKKLVERQGYQPLRALRNVLILQG